MVETDVSSERAVEGGCSDVEEFWLLGCLKIPKFLHATDVSWAYLVEDQQEQERLTMIFLKDAHSRRLYSL